MANFRKYIGNVEVSFPEGTSNGRELTDTETQHFDSCWKALKGRYHTIGKTELFGDEVKEALRIVLGIECVKRNTGFEGYTPSEGLGMQPIHAADVMGSTTIAGGGGDYFTQSFSDTWDVNWSTGATLTAGATMGTAGWRTWWGAPAAGAGAIPIGGATASDLFGGHRRVVGADFANNAVVWASVWWGVQDFAPAPKPKAIRVEQGKEVVGDHIIEDQLRGTELRYADLGRLYYFSHPQPFAAGVYISGGPTSIGLGHSTLKPVGVTIASALRLRQVNNGVRNPCAIIA